MNSKNLALSITMAIATVIMGSCVQAIAHETGFAHQSHLVSQSINDDDAISTYLKSDYKYCDAVVLSEFWGMSLDESKTRIGRKMLWGDADMGILAQFLVDARIQALHSLEQNAERGLCYFSQSEFTYQDAEKLAEYWGDATPWDAKIRIEKNLLLNNQETIDQALSIIKSGK